MHKLVTIESGEIEPIPETTGTFNFGILITEKTRLIIDGNNISIVFDDGIISEKYNYRLKLNENSNYQERHLPEREYFSIRFRNIISTVVQSYIKRPYKHFTYSIRKYLQTIFRKSHISDYDLMDLDVYLAKRILPKILEYRENYLSRQVRECPPLLSQDEQCFDIVSLSFSDTGELGKEEKAWVGVMDEIIFSMRWLLKADYAKKGDEEAFFIEYYGVYVSHEDNKEKYNEQVSLAEKRAQKGFELFGKFFTSFWY